MVSNSGDLLPPQPLIADIDRVASDLSGDKIHIHVTANTTIFYLMFIGPCIIAIADEWKTNLMSLAILFYFTYYALNMFRTLIYPSSGACDCVKITSDIKLVFHSSTIAMMHGPINISTSCVRIAIVAGLVPNGDQTLQLLDKMFTAWGVTKSYIKSLLWCKDCLTHERNKWATVNLCQTQ